MPTPRLLRLPVEARLFLQAHKTVNARVDRDLRAVSPLSVAEFEVLWRLDHAGGQMRFISLAQDVKLSQSRVSRQIDTLQAKGYVRREITGSNRRATFAVITDLGLSELKNAQLPFQKAWKTHFSDCISEEEMVIFGRCLKALMGDQELAP
jgi:DNA-binding MarR family transcriptional regulator